MKFSYLTGEVGNIGISKVKKKVFGNSWWLAGGVINAANCIAAYSPWKAPSYAASKVSVNAPGVHNAVDGSILPSWDVNGWTQSGGGYLTTDIVPALLSGYSMMAYFDNGVDVGATQVIAGIFDVFFYLCPRATLGLHEYANGGFRDTVGFVASGTLAVAGQYGYRDGLVDTLAITPPGTNPSLAIWIMCLHISISTTAYPFSGRLKRLALYDIPLSAAQVAALDTTIRI